jgi:hypothetical protein
MRVLALLAVPLALASCTCGGGNVSSRYGDLVVVQRGPTGREQLLREATVTLAPAFMDTVAAGAVPVRNVGQEELVIASVELVEGSPALSLDEAVSLAVPPGQDATLPVRFAPPQDADVTAVEVLHRASFRVRLSGARAGEDTLTLELVASAQARDCYVPAVVDFGAVPLRQAVVARVPLQNGRALAQSATFGPASGPDVGAFLVEATSPLEVPAGARVELPLRFSPLEERAYEARLPVQRGEGCPMAEVRLVGAGDDAALSWAPRQLDFGKVPLDVSVARTVTVTNGANVPLSLGSLLSGTDFALAPGAPSAVPARGSATVEVRCEPKALGPRSGLLTLELGTTPVTPARVPLTCIGGGPRIRVDPSPIQFGQVPISSTGATPTRRRIIVQNVGTPPSTPGDPANNLVLGRNGALPWFAIVPKNGRTRTEEFSVTRLGSYDNAVGLPALAGSNLAEFEVIIAPTDTGLREADLVVYSNDALEPELHVPLTASPRAPERCAVEITPEGFNFGASPRGAVLSRTAVIRNVGLSSSCLISGLELAPTSSLAFQLIDPLISSLVLDPGEARAVRVQAVVMSDAQPGDYLRGSLRFRVGTEPTLRSLPIDLRVSRCLVVDPPLVDLGLVQQGCTSGSKPVTLYNVCSVPITVAGTGGPTAPFRLVNSPLAQGPVQLDPGNRLSLLVSVAPMTTGPLADVLRIDTQEGGAAQSEGVALRATADPLGVQTDAFVQGDSQVDILFVIDDSCSMGDEQQQLASNFAAFISAATQGNGDWRIGVTTTDVFSIRGVLVRETATSVPWLTPSTPSVASRFSSRVRVGTGGSGFEQPLAAMELALTEPAKSGSNRGFLRADAALAVIVVTDALEQSPSPVSSYLASLRAAKANRPELVSLSVVGPFTASSPACVTEGSIDDGRYAAAIAGTNGVRSDICTTTWADDLRNISRSIFGARRRFELSGTVRGAADLTVSVDGAPSTGWTYSSSTNAVVFNTPPPPGARVDITYRTACF